jgi:hypothetical protein
LHVESFPKPEILDGGKIHVAESEIPEGKHVPRACEHDR